METPKLGAIERTPDERDFQLGSVQAPVQIPASFIPDVSWLTPNYQGATPACGAHAPTHFQAILEHAAGTPAPRYTPRYSWIKTKQIDGYPLEVGTDMRSIFKVLQNNGADDFEPLENDVTLPLATYSSPSVITPEMDADAAGQKIASYAFDKTDFDSICQAIYQNKAVILLIKVDNGWWGTTTPSFTTPDDGHFVCAYGYDTEYLYVVDSADQQFPFKKIGKQYVTSQFFFEAGTAIDLPPAQVQQIIQQSAAVVAALPTAPIPTAEKLTILQTIASFLQSLLPKVGSTSELMTSKSWYQSKTVWFNVLTIVVTLAGLLGYTPDQNIVAATGVALTAFSPIINLVLRFFTKQPINSPITQ